jgi:co-chaperonin GroES (HSP10)
MDLDVLYTGTTVDVPLWDCLVLAPPLIKERNGILLTDWDQDRVKEKGNWGLILKLGERAFEKEKEKTGDTPYHTGEWVFFQEYHPESRYVNDTMVYFIVDGRISGRIPDVKTWKVFHDIRDELEKMKIDAASKRSELLDLASKWEEDCAY